MGNDSSPGKPSADLLLSSSQGSFPLYSPEPPSLHSSYKRAGSPSWASVPGHLPPSPWDSLSTSPAHWQACPLRCKSPLLPHRRGLVASMRVGGRGGCRAFQESLGAWCQTGCGQGREGSTGETLSVGYKLLCFRCCLLRWQRREEGVGWGRQEAWSSGGSAGFRCPWEQPNRDSEEATPDGGLGTRTIENENVSLANRWKLRLCLWSRQRMAGTAQGAPMVQELGKAACGAE